jgi:CheY-like chemotaxis protein
VVLLTSFQDLSSTIARCALSNYAGYLTKPMSPREFVHQLAAVVAPAATSTALSPEQATGDGVRPLRVLVAEDNPVNQKLVERLLTREGHEVTMTANGRECFKAWREQPFDILLLDMQMPEMSGIEAAQQIRAAEAGSGQHVPILALTANTSGEDRDACLLAGIDEMLSKPISAPRLRASIARFAGRPA